MRPSRLIPACSQHNGNQRYTSTLSVFLNIQIANIQIAVASSWHQSWLPNWSTDEIRSPLRHQPVYLALTHCLLAMSLITIGDLMV
jgi:hypothetical protein